jgi:histidyl-tRNA synthetase
VAKGLEEETARRCLEAIGRARPSPGLQAILDAVRRLGVPAEAALFAPMLARGLDYYTGPIFEVFVPGFSAGSLAGGGRYDGLIEQLGGPSTPATGIAFGFDRVVEAATELGLVAGGPRAADVLVTVFDEATCPAALEVAAALRAGGIRCEVYPALDKMGKQLKLADQKGIPLVLVLGPDELGQGAVTIRNMRSGQQTAVPADRAAAEIAELLKDLD